jgi:hypothetical protein
MESEVIYRKVALHLILILILCYFSAYIDRNSPSSARWSSEHQKALIERDLAGDSGGTSLRTIGRDMTLSGALFDRQFYALALMSSAIIAGVVQQRFWRNNGLPIAPIDCNSAVGTRLCRGWWGLRAGRGHFALPA